MQWEEYYGYDSDEAQELQGKITLMIKDIQDVATLHLTSFSIRDLTMIQEYFSEDFTYPLHKDVEDLLCLKPYSGTLH
jgi:hypothetical protein